MLAGSFGAGVVPTRFVVAAVAVSDNRDSGEIDFAELLVVVPWEVPVCPSNLDSCNSLPVFYTRRFADEGKFENLAGALRLRLW